MVQGQEKKSKSCLKMNLKISHKIIESTFSFPEFVPGWKFIFESCGQTAHTHFWPRPPKKILISF